MTDRATAALYAARSDWWEAQYYVKGSKVRARRTAKREAARAARRARRASTKLEDI